jgi:hypothetical protein
LIFLSCEQEAIQFPNEWNLAWWITPLCSWYVWIGFFVFKSQMIIFLSSHDTMFVAVGENSQYLTQFSCFFNVYWSLRSTVDQILTSLSSPQVESKSPSQLNPIDLILALWALIKETYLTLVSKSTSQNFSDSSLEAETKRFPLGLNLRSWIWFWK